MIINDIEEQQCYLGASARIQYKDRKRHRIVRVL